MVLSSRSVFVAEFITRARELGERNDLSLHHARTLLDCWQDWCRWHALEHVAPDGAKERFRVHT